MNELNSRLAKAIVCGDLGAAERFVKQGADLYVAAELPGWSTLSPLHRAVQCGELEICRLILEAGADVNGEDGYKQTALFLATNYGSLEMLTLLLDSGAHVNVSDNFGNTPLHGAAREVFPGCCATLLERGANLFALTHDGRTPLHSAAGANRVEVCRFLISAGLALNFVPEATSDRYWTPFQTAVSENAIDVVRMGIEEFGEQVTQEALDGQSLFDLAVDSKDEETETFQLLLALRSEQEILSSLGPVLTTNRV
jgi:ankyrin repeat protein